MLIDAPVRTRLLSWLNEAGLGASTMYPDILPAIPGLELLLAGQGPFPVAERFASELLTLPAHAGVRDADIQKIAAGLSLFAHEKTV